MKLEIGDVLYLYNSEIIPNKSKYSLCVHIKPNYFLLINSKNRAMYECMPILKKNNAFLTDDSFIGCSNYFQYNANEIKDKEIVGRLGYEDLKSLYLHLKKNVKQLPAEVKNKILESLNDVLDDYR